MAFDATGLWFQIVLAGEDFVESRKAIELMDLLLAVVPADLAVLVNPEWSGHEVGELKGKAGQPVVVPPNELASRIGAFVRFRWGDIYFTTRDRQRSAPIVLDESIPTSLSKSLFAMRFVDGHLLFVYSPVARHLEVLGVHFSIAEATEVPFDDLVFPF